MSEGRTLLFSQREGYEPLPAPLQLQELPSEARIAIWNVLYGQMEASKRWVVRSYFIDEPWETILRDLYSHHDNRPLDEWSKNFDGITTWMRRRLEEGRFNHVFDVIEFLMRHAHCPRKFTADLSDVFRHFQLAYIIDPGAGPRRGAGRGGLPHHLGRQRDDSVRPPTIFPATTETEGNELRRNLAELHAAGLDGCTTHLRNASKCINDGDSAGSVRESIHAVESVARQIDPKASKDLGAALASLERQVALHPAFKQAISKLYGYTSDEQGIRHALLDKAQADVTIDEAVFMLGACASFASYLWRKRKAANTP